MRRENKKWRFSLFISSHQFLFSPPPLFSFFVFIIRSGETDDMRGINEKEKGEMKKFTTLVILCFSSPVGPSWSLIPLLLEQHKQYNMIIMITAEQQIEIPKKKERTHSTRCIIFPFISFMEGFFFFLSFTHCICLLHLHLFSPAWLLFASYFDHLLGPADDGNWKRKRESRLSSERDLKNNPHSHQEDCWSR